MIADDTLVTRIRAAGAEDVPVMKSDIKRLVRMLYLDECARSINPDDKVQKDLAAELVAYLLSP